MFEILLNEKVLKISTVIETCICSGLVRGETAISSEQCMYIPEKEKVDTYI